MRLQLKIENLGPLQRELRRLSGPEMRQAHADALNDVGFKLRRDMQGAIRSAFDRPTPFIERSPKVFKATPDRLSVNVMPTMHSEGAWTRGGKVGVDPQDVLQAQEWGGTRRDKRSEVALRRAGLLPAGYQTAIPAVPYPGSDDGRGNLRGAFLQRLLSYLSLHAEMGYAGNMKKRAKTRFEGARAYSNLRTRRQHVERDQRFFISTGRGAQTMGRMGAGGRYRRVAAPVHLAPGIWAARGTHGADLRPVLMFVRTPNYRPRISMDRIAKGAGVNEYFERRMRYRLRRALGQ